MHKSTALLANLILWACLLAVPAVAVAQVQDGVTTGFLDFNLPVEDTITDDSFFDLWSFTAAEGDVLMFTMEASGGLAPLIGIRQGDEVIARSDERPSGELSPASPDGIAILDFVAPESGEFILIATRDGNDAGTTTGSYRLMMELIDAAAARENPLQPVEFRCGVDEIVTAATLEFGEDFEPQDYRITLIGFDGFDPVLRFETGNLEPECITGTIDGTQILRNIPQSILALTDPDSARAVQHTISQLTPGSVVRLIVGSREGMAGPYLLLLEGSAINPPDDQDAINAYIGPLATDSDMLLYMLRAADSRIDPVMSFLNEENENVFTCDDAGRRDCQGIAAVTDLDITLPDGTIISGDRLNAGLRINTSSPDPVRLLLETRSERTTGAYALLIIGALPNP